MITMFLRPFFGLNMNSRFALLHRPLFVIMALCISVTLSLTSYLGVAKPFSSFDWIDVLGEGGMTLVTLFWLLATLFSRLKGRVTNLLFIGLLAMHLSMLLDLLDEFWTYPNSGWITTFESIPATLGMMVMSVALYHWHHEQISINDKLQQRERFYRDHSLTDFVTGLYSAAYMKQQLNREVQLSEQHAQPFSLLMFDLKQFDQLNNQYGTRQADDILRQVAECMQLNCRVTDLICRFASDRFIVFLPATPACTATVMMHHLQCSLTHTRFKTPNETQLSAYCSHVTWQKGHTGEQLIEQLCQQLAVQKLPNSVAA